MDDFVLELLALVISFPDPSQNSLFQHHKVSHVTEPELMEHGVDTIVNCSFFFPNQVIGLYRNLLAGLRIF